MWYIIIALVSGIISITTFLVVERYALSQILDGLKKVKRRTQRLNRQEANLFEREKVVEAFDVRRIQFDHLREENNLLKQDIFNLYVEMKKQKLDQEHLDQRQKENQDKANQLASRYLSENVKSIGANVTANNFATSKKRLLAVIGACRDIGFNIPQQEEDELVAQLQSLFEDAVRKEFHRQEQARIKERIREEQKLEREIQRELKKLERDRVAIAAALEKALSEAEDKHSSEIEQLRQRLREAEERSQRAKSQAEMTRAGYVYVISNIGAFGKDVFKIGMTRRLEPQDRVRELSAASVPFPFDVHMMISSDDAPSLETALHQALHKGRLNKVNLRKEFFRSDLETIRSIVESNHGEVEYVADPEALEYHESLELSDEDAEFVEKTYERLLEESGDSGFSVE